MPEGLTGLYVASSDTRTHVYTLRSPNRGTISADSRGNSILDRYEVVAVISNAEDRSTYTYCPPTHPIDMKDTQVGHTTT